MIYKIGNIADMKNLPPLEKNFEIFLTNCAKSLTAIYGADRNVDNDDGGYLLYVEKGTPHDEIKKCFDYATHTLEYANVFYEVACVTYLLNNEFAVTLVMYADNLPKEIEKELELC